MTLYSGVYSTSIQASFSGTRELFGITAAADSPLEIIRAELGMYNDATPPTDTMRCQMGPVTASGSGGGSVENPLNSNYPTAGGVTTANGATLHTLTAHLQFAFHIQHGMLYLPVPEERPVVSGGEEWGWNITNGSVSSQNFAWYIVWGEL